MHESWWWWPRRILSKLEEMAEPRWIYTLRKEIKYHDPSLHHNRTCLVGWMLRGPVEPHAE